MIDRAHSFNLVQLKRRIGRLAMGENLYFIQGKESARQAQSAERAIIGSFDIDSFSLCSLRLALGVKGNPKPGPEVQDFHRGNTDLSSFQ